MGATRKPDEATPEEGNEAPSAQELAAMPDRGNVTAKSGKLTAWVRRGVEVWIKDASGERKLVPGGELHVANADANLPRLEQLLPDDLAIAPDDQRVYFQRDGWETSRALFYAEVATGKVFFFHDANGYKVIDECRDKAQIGRVITFEHSYFDIFPTSAADLFFLVDAAAPKPREPRTGGSGRLGPLGFEDDNVARFLNKVCSLGKAPPAKKEELPPKLRGGTVSCQGHVLKRDDLRLLDGTTMVRFRQIPQGDEVAEVMTLDGAASYCGLP